MLGVAVSSLAPYPWLLTGFLVVVAAATGAVWGRATGRRKLDRALQLLDDAADGLARGEPARIPTQPRGERARLAKSFNAMAEAVEERELVAAQLAMTDPETGLPNRRALEAELAALSAAGESGAVAAAVSIDRYAELLALIGQESAAGLLSDTAHRLGQKAPAALIGRLSPDALGVVFGAGGAKVALAAASSLGAALEGPTTIGDLTADITFTVGVAPAGGAAGAERSPLVRAVIAMEQARARRRKLATFDAVAYGEPAASRALMSQMQRAIEAGQIEVHHQPRYDIRQGKTVGFEAFVRWWHPKRGLLNPGVFVRPAEATGQIGLLTDHVLATAIADQAALRRAGHDLSVSVNITARLLSDPTFVDRVLTLAGAAEGPLRLEVTGAAIVECRDEARRHIERLADGGVGISIDDYGSGPLPFARLREIRAAEVKIDKSLILDLADAPQNTALVRSLIALGHSLGMQVTAKGVETSEVYALLAAMGCDCAQGFLIERAMPLKDLLAFLAEESGLATRYG